MTIPVLLFLFRKDNGKVDSEVKTVVTDYIPSFLMIGVVVTLIIASFFENKPELTNGFICLSYAVIGVIYEWIRTRSTKVVQDVFHAIDYQTLLLLFGLFIVIGGITEAGVIKEIANLFVKVGGTSEFGMYTMIVFVSVILSAFIDNIPYVATMLPVVTEISTLMGVDPYLFYFGLLIGATLGGNITPVGASANIAGIGILNKEGYEVKTRDFMRIGIPFTLVAVLSGYIFLWFVWG